MSSTLTRPLLTRAQSWAFGMAHREALVEAYMTRTGRVKRPFLWEITDELLEEEQGVRLLRAALPLDRFAQTEARDGRIEVTVNTRIAEIPGVKDIAGIEHVAKWHESIHVVRDMPAPGALVDGYQAPPRIVCGRAGGARRLPPHELVAEMAGIAAAIAEQDLLRCPPFLRLYEQASAGRDLCEDGWSLLRVCSVQIGVNPTALTRYLAQRGLFTLVDGSSKRHLYAPRPTGRALWPLIE